LELADIGFLITPAMNFDVDLLSQFTAEIFNVYASAAIDVRRIFTGEESGSHGSPVKRRSYHDELLRVGACSKS
jgi:hypothetical protein